MGVCIGNRVWRYGSLPNVFLVLCAPWDDLVKFCQLVLTDAGFMPGDGLVIDGVRHLDTVRVLKHLFGEQPLKVIYLDSSMAVRRQRGSLTADDLDRLDSHPVEAETQAVKNIADFVLDTSLLTPDDCLGRLRCWAQPRLRPDWARQVGAA